MKRTDSPLFGCAILLANGAALSTAFGIFSLMETGAAVRPGTPVWLVCVLLCQLALYLYLRRPRSQHSVVLICIVCWLVQCVLVFVLYGRFSGLVGILIAMVMWAYTYFRCYSLAVTPPSTERVMGAFELSAVMLMIGLFFFGTRKLPLTELTLLAVTAVVTLAALVLRRTAGSPEGRGAALRGSLLMMAAAAAFGGAAVLFGGAVPFVKNCVTGLWSGVARLGVWLFQCLETFMRWLVSLFPEQELGDVSIEDMAGDIMFNGAVEETALADRELVVTLIAAAVLLVIAFVAGWFLFHGRDRLSRTKVGGSGAGGRRERGLAAGLRALLERLRQSLVYRVGRVLHRNTAPGLFAWLEERSVRRRSPRRPEESCREFLDRIVPDYPGGEEALAELADGLDRWYFAGEDVLDGDRAAELRRVLRRAARDAE